MDRSIIKELVTSYIEQDLGGQEIENPKCDFKAKWYNLEDSKDISEFLKDASAIANTFGLDGYIIIGYNSKAKSFTQATFSDSKLKDTSYLNDLINKKIDRLFDIAVYDLLINNNKISVLHIPPSTDKPHVIRNYQTFDKNNSIKKEEQNRIFVRKNSSTYPASKNDIELMFYDRKNIIPDYNILCSYHTDTLNIFTSRVPMGRQTEILKVEAGMNLVFENLGKRPVAIIEIQVTFTLLEEPNEQDIIQFSSGNEYRGREIIVQPNRIEGVTINLKSDYPKYGDYATESMVRDLNSAKKHIISKVVTLILSTGKKLKCNLIKVTT